MDALVPEEGEGAAATTAAAAAANRVRVGGLDRVDGTAVWYSKTSGVKPCEGPSHSSIRLPPPRHHEESYMQRKAHHLGLLEELQQRLDVVKAGGGAKAVEQHHGRGKALPRERIEAILDPGSKFLELSPLAAYELYDQTAHSAGPEYISRIVR